jgi:hypothetical protein
MTTNVFYQSTDRGMGNINGAAPVTYYGVSYRIPRSEHNTIRQLEWELPPRELLVPVTTNDGVELTPDIDGIVERFDTLDRETGDLIVTYRVPYQRG